jgi:hypothetical protein
LFGGITLGSIALRSVTLGCIALWWGVSLWRLSLRSLPLVLETKEHVVREEWLERKVHGGAN